MRTPVDASANKVDTARRNFELARSRLERSARRWAELRTPRALADLQRSAGAFDQAQRKLDATVRSWARVITTFGGALDGLR
ncbi:MAG: hypothetical protein NVSMB23_03290 [Myxococcales bacterium]